MTWTVEYHPDVAEDLNQLGRSEASRILRVVEERIIKGEPEKAGKPLRKNLAGCRRIRTGNTRIVYQIDNQKIKVLIIAVGPRRNDRVYKLAEGRV